jgi:hypothetical protein
VTADSDSEIPDASRLSWDEICERDDCRGRWVALDECVYDEDTGKATSGTVVDVDDDLVDLCERLKESAHLNCAIVFCEASKS